MLHANTWLCDSDDVARLLIPVNSHEGRNHEWYSCEKHSKTHTWCEHIEAETKWSPISLRQFQMEFVIKIYILQFRFTGIFFQGSSLQQIKAWHRTGDKPLSEKMIVYFYWLHIYRQINHNLLAIMFDPFLRKKIPINLQIIRHIMPRYTVILISLFLNKIYNQQVSIYRPRYP